MTRIQVGLTLPEKLWEKAKKQYGQRKTSHKIQELLEEDLEEDFQETRKFLELKGLTHKRKELVKHLFLEDDFPYSRAQISGIARKKGIYSSKQYIKKAVKVIDKKDIPVERRNGKLISTDRRCSCDASFSHSLLKHNDWECPNCGAKYRLGV